MNQWSFDRHTQPLQNQNTSQLCQVSTCLLHFFLLRLTGHPHECNPETQTSADFSILLFYVYTCIFITQQQKLYLCFISVWFERRDMHNNNSSILINYLNLWTCDWTASLSRYAWLCPGCPNSYGPVCVILMFASAPYFWKELFKNMMMTDVVSWLKVQSDMWCVYNQLKTNKVRTFPHSGRNTSLLCLKIQLLLHSTLWVQTNWSLRFMKVMISVLC